MAVYICKCGFCFERAGAAEQQCPDCGGVNVRFADEKEKAEYRQNREESDRLYSREDKAGLLV